ESVLGFLVARIAVGVVLEGELAIGGLDLLLGGVAGNAQDFVVVALCGHGSVWWRRLEGVDRRVVMAVALAHGLSMAWPMIVAAFSISTRRAFRPSKSPSLRAFLARSIAAR